MVQFIFLVSALIRHNQPGVAAFRLGNGYAALKDALNSDDVRFQRLNQDITVLVSLV